MSNVLITYYTKTNTTKEICDYIGKKLNNDENETTVKPMSDVKNVKDYDIVVLGAPINGMNWAQDAKDFVEQNKSSFENKKVAIFFNSYLLDNGRSLWQKAIHKSLDKYKTALKPIAVGEFYGRVDKAFTGIPKFIFGNRINEPLDRRNWKQIDEFIKKIR